MLAVKEAPQWPWKGACGRRDSAYSPLPSKKITTGRLFPGKGFCTDTFVWVKHCGVNCSPITKNEVRQKEHLLVVLDSVGCVEILLSEDIHVDKNIHEFLVIDPSIRECMDHFQFQFNLEVPAEKPYILKPRRCKMTTLVIIRCEVIPRKTHVHLEGFKCHLHGFASEIG